MVGRSLFVVRCSFLFVRRSVLDVVILCCVVCRGLFNECCLLPDLCCWLILRCAVFVVRCSLFFLRRSLLDIVIYVVLFVVGCYMSVVSCRVCVVG